MRQIEKRAAPGCLADCRRGLRHLGREPAAADWDLLRDPCKPEVRGRLLADQGSLCAYCQSKLKNTGYRDDDSATGNGGTRIEHIKQRNQNPHAMFDWNNIIAVCGGRYVPPTARAVRHCDASRPDDHTLELNPLERWRDLRNALGYERDPERRRLLLVVRETDANRRAQYERDISTLNLNADHLARWRRDLEQELGKQLRRRDGDTKAQRQFAQEQLELARSHEAPAFADVVVRYLERKLRSWPE